MPHTCACCGESVPYSAKYCRTCEKAGCTEFQKECNDEDTRIL